MRFTNTYTTNEKKQKNPNKEKDKTEITNDAYAIGELVEILTREIERIRTTLKK